MKSTEMIRLILLVTLSTALPAYLSAEEAKHNTTFGDKITIPANIDFSTNVSQDKQATTILFDNAIVATDPSRKGVRSTSNQTAIQTKSITLNIPFTSEQQSFAVAMDIRGFHESGSGASTRLIACAGDRAQVIDLSSCKEKAVKLKGKSKKAFVDAQPDRKIGDFQDRVEFEISKHAAKPVLQLTLILIAEQDSDEADQSALLVVDSLDLQIHDANK